MVYNLKRMSERVGVEACEQRWCPNHAFVRTEPETQKAMSGNPEHRSFKAASFEQTESRPCRGIDSFIASDSIFQIPTPPAKAQDVILEILLPVPTRAGE